MKKIIINNLILIVASVIVSFALTLVIGKFIWSFKIFSEVLGYTGITVALYGSYKAANISMWFGGIKENINIRYSEEKENELKRLKDYKVLQGWFTIFASAVIILLSVVIYRL